MILGTKMQVESNSDDSLPKRNALLVERIHNEVNGSFHNDQISNIKSDPSLGVSMPGNCVPNNRILVISDEGGDKKSDDDSLINMPGEELTKWKTSIQNKISQSESNKSFNQAHVHLLNPSLSLLAPGSIQRPGLLAPLLPIQENFNEKIQQNKSGKKKSKQKKKIKNNIIKKETMQWPAPNQATTDLHCDSSTDSFSMPSFELAEDLALKSTEDLSGSKTNVNLDFNDPLSSVSVQSRKQVKFKEDDEVFFIDSFNSADEESSESCINSDIISEGSFQFSHEVSLSRRNFREDMNRKMNEELSIDSYESSD